MNVNKYKNRFFSLLESELGNVKPLITESIEGNQSAIEDILVDEYGFEKVGQAQKGGDFNIQAQYDKKFGNNELSFVIMFNQEDATISPNSIVMTIFLEEEGKGGSRKITSEVVGGSNTYVIINSDNIKTEGKDIIKKAVDMASKSVPGEKTNDEEGTSLNLFDPIMKSLGLTPMGSTGDTAKYSKKLNDEKSFLVLIKDDGSKFIIKPVVFDHAAQEDPILYGNEIPVIVGTMNIEKKDLKGKVLGIDVPYDDVKTDESSIKEELRKQEKIANDYKGKMSLEKELTSTERLR
jgi:hypothetical protein